ncbi:MAG: redoxin domain-containing protein [Myxococcota bacterium]
MQNHAPRRRIGERLEPFVLDTLSHGTLRVPAAGTVHLQFRRFAGCPVCNLQVRRFSAAHDALAAAGVTTVTFFHSAREAMLPYQAELPSPVVPDPDRRWYAHFGVERSFRAIADPRVWATAVQAFVTGPSNPLEGGAQDGLPADFLVDPSGVLRAVHYGTRADDQWSVDDVLALAGA